MIVNEVFPIPIFHTKATEHEKIKKYVMDEIYPVYEENGYNSKSCKVFSDYFPGAPIADQDLLSNLYRDDIYDLLRTVGFSEELPWRVFPYFWYNITGEGGWQEQHDHISGPLPSQFSGIHYVKYDKDEHKPVEFENPLATLLRSMAPSSNKESLPEFFRALHAYPKDIEEGDIIIFPSYLKHAVNIQESTKDRISIAFNLGVWNHEFIK